MVVAVAGWMRVLVVVVMVVADGVRVNAVIVLVVRGVGRLDEGVVVEAPRRVRVRVLVVMVLATRVRVRVKMAVAVIDETLIRGSGCADGHENDAKCTPRRHPPSAVSAVSASCAARCSASFFERPRPRAASLPPSTTATSKLLAWPGPSSATTM